MSYRGSEAPRLDYAERARERDGARRRSFDVVEGGGLDARVRQGVSPVFLARARVIMVLVAAFVVLGSVRVWLTTATVGYLSGNLETQELIEEAEDLNSALRIERSVLSNTTRITRIATQNYGMVYATEHDHVEVVDEEALAAEQAAQAQQNIPTDLGTTANGQEISLFEQGVKTVMALLNAFGLGNAMAY